ncbi:hypothetical protein GA0070616_0074 [Micromonospora nigra]|uniref:Uncharacterized protein n=2 Tax=Micromonospora nigra TaxID=145857 RepID=A0A1C6R7D4_9ACTN|nr:hypothetical protein GA0070616_0074 [Micromonospora nigra]
MVSDSARKKAVRQRMGRTGENYTTASRAIAREQAKPGMAATRPGIDPRLLVPYPDELVRPADAGDGWQPVTTDELGWRVLAVDASAGQRARAESVWRPVTADRPCRCSGQCLHGQLCNNGEDGIGSCTGRLVHHDRLAASLLTVDGWYDFYACDSCGEEFEASVDLPDVPWGEHFGSGFRQFDGVRRITFHASDPGWCPDCGGDPCRCDEVYCDECGADSNYQCSCYEYAQ